MDIAASALQSLPQEPRDVLGVQVGLQAIGKQLDDVAYVGDIAKSKELLGSRLEEGLLHLNAPEIAVFIVLTETAQAHTVKTVQKLVSGVNVNVEILADIPVVHLDGHVKPDAAQLVDHILEGHQIYHRIAVYINAGEPFDVHQQAVNAGAAVVEGGAVNRVELAHIPGDVDERVAGQAHAVDLVVLCVKAAENHGVCALTDLVDTHKEHGVYPVSTLQGGCVGDAEWRPVRHGFGCGLRGWHGCWLRGSSFFRLGWGRFFHCLRPVGLGDDHLGGLFPAQI